MGRRILGFYADVKILQVRLHFQPDRYTVSLFPRRS
jgi:hypothetical protein